MHDLGDFSLRDMAECTAHVRRLGHGAGSMEEAASRIVTYLYDDLTDRRGAERACALVRFYKTHPYGLLDAGRRRFAEARSPGESAPPSARFLALLAAAGDERGSMSVPRSHEHQAIPFGDPAATAHVPTMIRHVTELGVDLSVAPPSAPTWPSLKSLELPQGNAFHVAAAKVGAEIPVHDALRIQHKIRSILGFGGLLPGGDLFVVVLFTRVPIADAARELFQTLALAVKVGVMSFDRGPTFS
jgi:hypothetical protein